jgi:hypothetical protein
MIFWEFSEQFRILNRTLIVWWRKPKCTRTCKYNKLVWAWTRDSNHLRLKNRCFTKELSRQLYCLCAQDNLGVKKVLAPRKTLKFAEYVFLPHKETFRRIRISGALKAKLGNHGEFLDQRYRTESDARMLMSDWGNWISIEMPMPDYLFSGISAFNHVFQHHIARITPSAAVDGGSVSISTASSMGLRAGCTPFYHQQFRRTRCIPCPPPAVRMCRLYPLQPSESVATLPPFGPIEGQKWFDRISSQWQSRKNRFAFISYGKIRFLPPCIWNIPFMSYSLGSMDVQGVP